MLFRSNFLSGEHLVGLAEGRPLVMRRPEGTLSLATLMRAHLFAAFASMAHGLRVLRAGAEAPIDSMFAHGGIFTTPEIPQRVLAAAFDTPVSVGATASQGGAWGMALLAGYRLWAAGPGGPALICINELISPIFFEVSFVTSHIPPSRRLFERLSPF